jgi:hypothetical protein
MFILFIFDFYQFLCWFLLYCTLNILICLIIIILLFKIIVIIIISLLRIIFINICIGIAVIRIQCLIHLYRILLYILYAINAYLLC